jgi:hypothetical protein
VAQLHLTVQAESDRFHPGRRVMNDRSEYKHRKNEDGTWDSICPMCHATVAIATQEAFLSALEREHGCRPSLDEMAASFGYGQRFSAPCRRG